jgi:threonine dehydrogenase-like Zn-dependent dehydrogenase
MKALCYFGPLDMRYETIPDARIEEDGDVIVKMKCCGICGSDLHHYHGSRGKDFTDDTGYCVGHEAIGEVVEVGRDVSHRKVGDPVMLSAAVGCGMCQRCLAGDMMNCLLGRQRVYGLSSAFQGCQSEAIRVPAGDFNTAIIPDGISDAQALMLTDNLPTAWFGCKNAEVKPGDSVVVIGLGPIGLLCVESAFLMGAAQVFAIDLVAERRELAAALGAIPLNSDPSAIEAVREHTKGLMADSVIDVAGVDAAVFLAMKLIRRAGVISVLGGSRNNEFVFPLKQMYANGLTLRTGACSMVKWWPELIPLLLQRRLTPERYFTHTVSLSDGRRAYEIADARSGGSLKVMIKPE